MIANHPDLGKEGQIEKRRLIFNHIMEDIIISNFQQSERTIIDEKKSTIPDPLGSMINYSIDLNVAHPKDVMRITELII